MTAPNPLEWTLRLKARKTTVLLLVDPLDKFSTIKSALLTALHETGLKDPETGEALSLPEAPANIQLGRPVNINDPDAGFKLGEWEYEGSVSGEDESGKGKGKAKAVPKKANGAVNAAMDCPKGAGLKDGSVLAFRWKGDGVWDGAEPELDIDEDDEIVAAKGADMWGVKMASYEDAYGVEEGMDVGGGRPYEG